MLRRTRTSQKIWATVQNSGIDKYAEWLKTSAVLTGQQIINEEDIMPEVKKKRGRPRKKETKPRVQNVIVIDKGNPCPKCGNAYGHRVQNTYPNGRRRVICGEKERCGCGHPFLLEREVAIT